MSLTVPSPRLAAIAAAASGLTAVLTAFAPSAGAAAVEDSTAPPAVATASTTSARTPATGSWFVDPRTPAQRRAEVPVPRRPRAYGDRVRETRAVYRTRDGALAVPMRYAWGHQVREGQALTLDGAGLFDVGRTVLNVHAQNQLRKTATALRDASSIRCEGYADYLAKGGLARARANRVCDSLASLLPGVRTRVVSYGPSWPAVLGGTSAQRGLNRRVVVEVTGTRPAGPTITVPGAPTLQEVNGGNGVAYFAFSAPVSDGGAPVTSYQVSTGGAWSAVQTLAPSRAARLCRGCGSGYLYGQLLGLEAGSEVTVRVRAVNRVGAGKPSNALTTTVHGTASAPTELSTTGDDGTITTTFGAPAHLGGAPVQRYEISYDGGLTWTTADTTGPGPWTVVKEGFENGVVYDVAVRAVTDWGTGQAATDSVRVATVPGAPEVDAPVLDDDAAEITFRAPASDGGEDITGYEISLDGGTTWNPADYTEADPGVYVTHLVELTYGHAYGVKVRALNERGHGPASVAVTVAPVTTPGAPTGLTATVDGASVDLAFTAPASDGGSEITGYEVSVDAGPWGPLTVSEGTDGARTATVGGQQAGTHTYAVRAVNAKGSGASVAADPVEVVVVAKPMLDHSYSYHDPTVTWYHVYFRSATVDLARVTGWEVSVNDGPWLPVSVFSSNPGAPADGTLFMGEAQDIGCVSTGGICTDAPTTGRVRAVYADGHSPASETAPITWWD